MANHQVKVGVSQFEAGTRNEFKAEVRPWALHMVVGDTFDLVAAPINGHTPSPITLLDIRRKRRAVPRPVRPVPSLKPKKPHPQARARRAFQLSPALKKKLRGLKRRTKTRVAYSIYLEFTSADGQRRSATIDPDMVIES